jgi:hypothetical protein
MAAAHAEYARQLWAIYQDYWQPRSGTPGGTLSATFYTPTSSANTVGRAILELDRAVRTAAAWSDFVGGSGPDAPFMLVAPDVRPPRPGKQDGHLDLVAVETASFLGFFRGRDPLDNIATRHPILTQVIIGQLLIVANPSSSATITAEPPDSLPQRGVQIVVPAPDRELLRECGMARSWVHLNPGARSEITMTLTDGRRVTCVAEGPPAPPTLTTEVQPPGANS